MTDKKRPTIVKNQKVEKIDELFAEVQGEIDEDIVKDSKIKIKDLLLQKSKTEKILGNLNRQIDELKLQISQELG